MIELSEQQQHALDSAPSAKLGLRKQGLTTPNLGPHGLNSWSFQALSAKDADFARGGANRRAKPVKLKEPLKGRKRKTGELKLWDDV
jgi:hypothetical protein